MTASCSSPRNLKMLSKTDAGKKEQIETAQQRKEIERMEATEATEASQGKESREVN